MELFLIHSGKQLLVQKLHSISIYVLIVIWVPEFKKINNFFNKMII